MEEFLQKRVQEILTSVKTYITAVENCNLTDRQWFIEFEDELNKLSVLDHNNGVSNYSYLDCK